MPAIDMKGLDTQSDAMGAIQLVLDEYQSNAINAIEAMAIINAISTEFHI